MRAEPGSEGVRAEPESEPDPSALVECRFGGRSVFTRRDGCPEENVVERAPREAKKPAPNQWAALNRDSGITLIPVLACRTQEALMRVTSAPAPNRPIYAQAHANRGRCTRLPAQTFFFLTGGATEPLQIRTMALGRVWVSPSTRVPGLEQLDLPERPPAW